MYSLRDHIHLELGEESSCVGKGGVTISSIYP